MKERKSIKKNLPYTLTVWEGTDYSGDNSVAGDERERILIGSEIDPILLGKYEEDFTGNGSFSICEYYLIQQKGQILLVEQWATFYVHSYNTEREDWEFKVYELPVAEGFKPNESLAEKKGGKDGKYKI